MTPQQIEAMKLALEALKAMQMYAEAERKGLRICDEAITALEEVLKEHAMREAQRLGQEIEQEPIGFVQQSVLDWLYSKHRSSNAHTITTIAKSPTETEDVAIYTTPPKREWVGLMDEDIWEAYMESPVELDCSTDELYAISRTVEAKLKEKNT